MQKGDLTSTPLAPLLLSLADEETTGCLHISDAEGDEALIYFKAGLVYAVSVPGRRPQLGAKLVSSGALAPEALAEALDAQRTELQGWKLGELLVHLGYVDQPVVEAFVKEQVNDAVWDLIRWTEGRWRFRKNEKTREDVAPPMAVTELLTTLRDRGIEWEAISDVVHGPTAVPVLSTGGGGAPETTLDADAWSLLCKIDGERSVAELARDCGYTMFEAGQVLVSLVQAGLVDIEEDVEFGGFAQAGPPAPAVESAAALEAMEALEALEAMATVEDLANVEGVEDVEGDSLYGATTVSSALVAAAAEDDAAAHQEQEVEHAPVDDLADLARLVSEVAAGIREDEAEAADAAAFAAEAAAAAEQPPVAAGEPAPGSVPLRSDGLSFSSSVERVSAALAEVLGPAPVTDDPYEVPAEMRVKRSRRKERPKPPPLDERAARVRAAAAQELAAAHALAQALREAAAAEPSAAELAVATVAAAEQAAADEAAREAANEAAARAAVEELARLAAAEAAQAEAERIAAEEEAAHVEAERIAAEEAERLEAERIAAEEAERLEAERVAAEEAERLEAERIAAEEEAARVEAERVAAEEAERLEAERVAAEEAARVEAERVAAEEEAARVEAERVAAEEAAQAEAAQLAAEKAEAEDQAWTEYWSREAERVNAEEAAAAAIAAEADRLAAAQALELAEEAARRAADEAEAREREQMEAEEAARQLRNKSAASAALAELASADLEPEAPVADPEVVEPAPSLDSEHDGLDDDVEEFAVPVSVGAPAMEMADTAALLRELSSLGFDDEPSGPHPPPRAPSRPAPTYVDPKKKKRGLFGR
jgi:hypothetical protein